MIVRSSFDLIKLRIGDKVSRTDDSRHVGRVEAIHPTMVVTIKWENGWKELVDYRELERS